MQNKERLQEIEKNLSEWKKEHNSKTIPKNLLKKQQRAWLNEVYLTKQDGELIISGGGRVLLWLAVTNNGKIYRLGERNNWKNYLDLLIQKKQWGNYFEVLKFRYREKLFDLDLIKKVDVDWILDKRLDNLKGRDAV